MKKLNYQKGISPIIGVLVIAVILIGGAYLFKQYQTKQASESIDETANWKTYTNINGNFIIQYPADWKLTETHTISSAVPNEINAVTFKGTEGEFYLGWNEPYGGGGCDYTKVVNLKQISIKGCDDIANGNEYWNLLTYKPNNSKYLVHMSAIATPSGNANLIRKIFSTLEFTDQNQAISQADIDAIKKALLPIFDTTSDKLVFDINTDLANQYNGMFASGHASIKGTGGGGVWIAAKANGIWKIANYGNGIPKCSALDPFNVPVAFGKSCADTNNDLVDR